MHAREKDYLQIILDPFGVRPFSSKDHGAHQASVLKGWTEERSAGLAVQYGLAEKVPKVDAGPIVRHLARCGACASAKFVWYEHQGVYVSHALIGGKLFRHFVFEFTQIDLGEVKGTVIRMVPLATFLDGHEPKIIRHELDAPFLLGPGSSHVVRRVMQSPDVVIQRGINAVMRGMAEEVKYNPVNYNCEHVANWLCTGVFECYQTGDRGFVRFLYSPLHRWQAPRLYSQPAEELVPLLGMDS